jgi:hypothetical protein
LETVSAATKIKLVGEIKFNNPLAKLKVNTTPLSVDPRDAVVKKLKITLANPELDGIRNEIIKNKPKYKISKREKFIPEKDLILPAKTSRNLVSSKIIPILELIKMMLASPNMSFAPCKKVVTYASSPRQSTKAQKKEETKKRKAKSRKPHSPK